MSDLLDMHRAVGISYCAAIVLVASVARADIYEWEYINPSDPAEGKQQSTTLVPGGAGVSAVPGAVLNNRNLTKAYLIGANVAGANFQSSNLTNADFSLAVVSGANLLLARLDNAVLRNANLENASLAQAYLTNADLTGASVSGVNFDQVTSRGFTAAQLYSTASYQAQNLAGVRLSNNDLNGWDFTSQNLTGAYFLGGLSAIGGANFSGAIIKDAVVNGFTQAQVYSTASYITGDLGAIRITGVSGWNFAGKNLEGARFEGQLTGTDFSNAIVRGANFSSVTYLVPNGFTAPQLYSTASYQAGDLAGVQLANQDLSGWDFSGQDLTFGSVGNSNLTGTIFTNADVRGTFFYRDPGIPGQLTATQLNSTASYQMNDLSWIVLSDSNLSGWDFSGQNLYGAAFHHADLTGADFTGANIVWAQFSYHTTRGTGQLSQAQLYSTASYQSGNLERLRLHSHNLSGWDFSGQYLHRADLGVTNLAGTDFSHAYLASTRLNNATFSSSTNLTAADLRGVVPVGGVNTGSAITTNTILPNGEIAGLDLTGGQYLTVRDYDGRTFPTVPPLPILIRDQLVMDENSLLKLLFESDEWNSLISFESGISVTLDGALELDFVLGTPISNQVGRTIRIFDWNGVSPIGQFTVSSAYNWDISKLYTTGEVTLLPDILPGDFNEDGTVDAADYVAWRKIPERFGGDPQGYNDWHTNFGVPPGSGIPPDFSPPVPEPSCVLLAAIGACIGLTIRRRRAIAFMLSLAAMCTLPDNAALAVVQPGDYNGDGICDAADYAALRKLPDIFHGDSLGYRTWRENFAESAFGSAPPTSAVTTPEPSSALLALIGGLVGYAATSRRRR